MEVGQLRGLQLLETLAGMQQPAGLTAIVSRTGLSQTQAFRALQALEREGYVEHVGRRGYRIGSRAVAIAAMIGPRPALMRAIHPVVSQLAVATGQSVFVHLRSGNERVLVLGIPAPDDRSQTANVPGERSPLGSGCSGRVILAHLPADEASAVRHRVPKELLNRIRARGYDTSSGENHPGVNGVAGPLLEDDGTAIGAITIAGPEGRLPTGSFEKLAGPVLAACRHLSPRIANVLGPNAEDTVEALDLRPRND